MLLANSSLRIARSYNREQACRLPEQVEKYHLSKKKPRTDEVGIAQLFNRYNNNNNSININDIINSTINNGDNAINILFFECF